MNRTLVDLAQRIEECASLIALSMERREARDLQARAERIRDEAGRLAAELRTAIEPQPIREVLEEMPLADAAAQLAQDESPHAPASDPPAPEAPAPREALCTCGHVKAHHTNAGAAPPWGAACTMCPCASFKRASTPEATDTAL